MSMKLYSDTDIADIASAIRSKNGTQTQYKVSEMGDAVRAIQSGKKSEKITNTFSTFSTTWTFSTNHPEIFSNGAVYVVSTELASGGTDATLISALWNGQQSNGSFFREGQRYWWQRKAGVVAINGNSVTITADSGAGFRGKYELVAIET